MDIQEIKEGYINKRFSPVEITKDFLNRIEQHKNLHAYITVTAEKALNQAKISEEKIMLGEELGVLEGIPISIKDNVDTKGIQTTNGSIIKSNLIPDTNAYVIDKLQFEGAINLGKTNLPEFVFGVTGDNPHYGFTENPWNREYTPGGSSAGSAAAIVADLCVSSIGTDTSGSIRIPASSCGIVGLKPTYEYINNIGVKKHSWTLDHVGPLAKNMDDLAIMMDVLTGHHYKNKCTEDIRGLRIGVPKNYFNEQLDEEVEALFYQSLEEFEEMGAILIEVDIPFSNRDAEHLLRIALAEAAYSQKENLANHSDEIGSYIKELLAPAYSITAFDYVKGLENKEHVKHSFEQLFKRIDILATPTLPTTPQKIGVNEVEIGGETEDILDSMTRFVQVFNWTEQPALSIPCGVTTENLPVGLQLAAGRFQEGTLICAGYAYEKNFLGDFYKKRDAISERFR